MDIDWAIDQGELYLLQVTTSSAYLLVYYVHYPKGFGWYLLYKLYFSHF